ncbi:cation:proton antiporter [Streptomyces sp. NBC_00370]|uniref:cation:proton antiporter n=1 Tax=Streptomyces sp. NBC_00370 TaxID=2975728 RepID=UPI002E2541F2
MGALLVMSSVTRGRDFQANLVVVAVAGGASFLPGIPEVDLAPELILGLVVPPLLYSASVRFSFFTFVRNLRPILGLGVGLVAVTTLVAGVTASWLLPSLGLASALVLAAVVSPPDTVTAVAHGRAMGLPRRVIDILTGESLINDAASLAVLASAVAAVGHDETFISNPVLLFGYAVVAGVSTGILLGLAMSWIRARLLDSTLSAAFGVTLPFAAYAAAEQFHASGVLAVVFAGFTVSARTDYALRNSGTNIAHHVRLLEHDVWPVLDTLLEALVFGYIGFRLRFTLEDLDHSGQSMSSVAVLGLALLFVVIAVRLVWVSLLFARWALEVRVQRIGRDITGHLFPRMRGRRHRQKREPLQSTEALGARETLLVGWTGMRGIVTLAAASGIPLTTHDGSPFPHRAVIQFVAFIVVTGTLLLQGSTLRVMTRLLRIDTTADERQEAEAVDRALAIAHAADTAAGPRRDLDAQRSSLVDAIAKGHADGQAVRTVMRRIDLEEALRETSEGPAH